MAALLLVACGQRASETQDGSPGGRLETAARDVGVVVDPASVSLIGAWARDTDRVCIVPRRDKNFTIGARVDYGEAQGCAASGSATHAGTILHVAFGACRFDARFEGDRLVFPPEVPGVCDRLCTGRASLAALAVDRLSSSSSEAATLRTSDGTSLCLG